MRLRTLAWLALLAALAPAPASAQTRALEARFDNEVFAIRRNLLAPDHDYTHGTLLALELDGAPGWRWLLAEIPSCGREGSPVGRCLRSQVAFGQQIFTPRVVGPEPVPGERPYAAWMYLAAEARVLAPRRERRLAVELGVTGPPALGEPVQDGMHRLLGYSTPPGWEDQLAFEPGAVVRYSEAWPRRLGAGGPVPVRVAPYAGAAVGNVYTGARLGAGLRVGAEAPEGEADRRRATGYLLVDAQTRWVARNLFLDGNTMRDNSLAERIPLVAAGEAGVGLRYRGWELEYRFVVVGREYRAQEAPHRYGSVVIRRYP